MAKVVIIDQGEVGAALSLRAAQADHDVYWFIEEKDANNQHTGKNLHKNITKINNFIPYCRGADLVTCTENGKYLDKLEMLRKRGINVYAPSQAVADLEINREKGLKLFEQFDLPVPEYKAFNSLKEAEKHVWGNPERYVFKTMGDNDDKSLSYVSKSPEQMIQQLQFWQNTGVNPKGKVILQQFIEGVEFAVARWVGKDGFIGPWEQSQEHKKFMNDEIGPNTGEMGTILKYSKESKLGEELLLPLEEELVKLGTFTSFDLNCIIDKKGNPWILEPTCRKGWPAFNIQLLLHEGDPIQWMIDACQGKDTLKTSYDFGIGVVLAIPDFPYCEKKPKEVSDLPIYGITEKNEKYIQPQSIKMGRFVDNEDGEIVERKGWVTSGTYVAVVTQQGKTIEDAREKVYKIIDDLSLSNMMYRTDIGIKTMKNLEELNENGYAIDWVSEPDADNDDESDKGFKEASNAEIDNDEEEE